MNYRYGAWFTFRDIQIPAGAKINKATLVLTASANSSTNNVDVVICGHCDPNSIDNPEFPSTSGKFEAIWPRTATQVEWHNIPAWSTNFTQDSPDIACVIQEIIDLPGWEAGNALKLFIDDNDSTANHTREAYDYSTRPDDSAQLIIHWSNQFNEVGSGGITVGGSSGEDHYASGGFTVGGEATESQLFYFDEITSGGVVVGGEATVGQLFNYDEIASGGVAISFAPYANGYKYRVKITVPAGAVDANLSQYHLGIKAYIGRDTEGDVRVETAEGTHLAHDLRKELHGKVWVFFRAALLANSDNIFYLYYGR